MSTPKLITVICWIAVAVVMIGLVIWFLTGCLFGINTGFSLNAPVFNISGIDNVAGAYSEVGTYPVSAGSIDTIDLSWVSGAVTIAPYEGDTIKITEYAARALQDNEKLAYNVSGNTLKINYVAPGLSINMPTKKIELLVPKPLAGKLNGLSVNATSADVKISDFNMTQLNIRETSGRADVSNIKAGYADIHSVSGAINLSGAAVDTLKSGTTSGDQKFSGTFKSVETSSISGAINVTSSAAPDAIHCSTTSGGIIVAIPGNSSPIVSYSTTSGHFSSEIPVRTTGPAAYQFSSVSGDIRLKAAEDDKRSASN